MLKAFDAVHKHAVICPGKTKILCQRATFNKQHIKIKLICNDTNSQWFDFNSTLLSKLYVPLQSSKGKSYGGTGCSFTKGTLKKNATPNQRVTFLVSLFPLLGGGGG